ncbi:SIMPL domain-containing protein [Candidatus Saccharibacteria bacterium]|nr:SIMPL domain-containing protein [Candidatus Saccharibacteria bacterium]
MEPQQSSNKMKMNLDFRLLSIILLIIIVGMLALWQPWNDSSSSSRRKITISGEATVKAEPDEFVFNPSYNRKTLTEITTLTQEIISKLKSLGVTDKQIKTNANSYDKPELISPTPVPDGSSTITFTITLSSKELSQKVQDYLVTTDPSGSITPYPSFSTQKRKQLEDDARSKAIADAKSRANKTAAGLDAKIGKVIEVKEGNLGGGVYPLYDIAEGRDGASSSKSLPIQPGENELSYSVEVVFELR